MLLFIFVYLQSHLKAHENTGFEYQCEFCSIYFKTKAGKLTHERTQHNSSGTMIYLCTKCKSSFDSKDELNEHKRDHLGERPFKCDQCERDFVRESMLLLHQKQHLRENFSRGTINQAQKRMYLSTEKYESQPPKTSKRSRKK